MDEIILISYNCETSGCFDMYEKCVYASIYTMGDIDSSRRKLVLRFLMRL